MTYASASSDLVVDDRTAVMEDSSRVTAVLLTCSDATARQRLARREIGGALEPNIERGKMAARELQDLAPDWVHRVSTDDRTVADVAAEVVGLAGWIAD